MNNYQGHNKCGMHDIFVIVWNSVTMYVYLFGTKNVDMHCELLYSRFCQHLL